MEVVLLLLQMVNIHIWALFFYFLAGKVGSLGLEVSSTENPRSATKHINQTKEVNFQDLHLHPAATHLCSA